MARSGGGTGRSGLAVAVLVAVLAAAGCSSGGDAAPAPSRRGASAVVPADHRWSPQGVAMPADEPAPPVPAAPCPGELATGWTARENALPGSPDARIPEDTADGRDVLGYADRVSASCGETVRVALSGPVSTVRLEAYRVGAYRGAAARRVWMSGDLHVAPGRMPALERGTNLLRPAWPVTVAVPVTAAWTPGFYLLVPRDVEGAAGPAIPLVVRSDADRAPALFVASTMTWQAYGEWGGRSLYHGPGKGTAVRFASRARTVTLRRPLTGAGYEQLRHMDLSVVRQLEASGVDTDYTTDVDVDRWPSQLAHHAEVVLGGHAEYWTRRTYDALAASRAEGVNELFLGANNLWWHARLDRSPTGPPDTGPPDTGPDLLTVYRERAGDPTPPSRPADLTLLWSQWPEHRDPATMLGASHAGIAVRGGYQVAAAPDWLLAGTGLHAAGPGTGGSVLPMAVGNEADGYDRAAGNPAALTVVAQGVLLGGHGPVLVTAGYHTTSTGSAIFVAGTTDWACAPAGRCADQRVPAGTARAIGGMTRNLIREFARVRAGTVHPSVESVPPGPPAALVPLLDPVAVGRYGVGADDDEEGAHEALGMPRR